MKTELKLVEIIENLNNLGNGIKGFKGTPHEVHVKMEKLIQSYVLQIGLEPNTWEIKLFFMDHDMGYKFTKLFYYRFDKTDDKRRSDINPYWTINSVHFYFTFNFKNIETLGEYVNKLKILSETDTLRRQLNHLRNTQKELNNIVLRINNTMNNLIKLKK